MAKTRGLCGTLVGGGRDGGDGSGAVTFLVQCGAVAETPARHEIASALSAHIITFALYRAIGASSARRVGWGVRGVHSSKQYAEYMTYGLRGPYRYKKSGLSDP